MPDKNTLLIVDDSKVSRMMIRGIVESRMPDWELVEAGSGEEALEKTATIDIDFFSLDLNMPGMDGLELIEKLREKHANTPKVLMTANTQEGISNRANELGASCIHKPITEESIDKMLAIFND